MNPPSRFSPETSLVQRVRFPADLTLVPEARQGFLQFLAELDVPQNRQHGWKLACTELLNNAVQHGARSNPAAFIELTWEFRENTVILTVADPGPGPDDDFAASARLPDNPDQTHGRGRFLVAAFADEIREWRGPQGYRVEIRQQSLEATGIAPPGDELRPVLNELSACYEGLAAFYQLGESLARAHTLGEFLERSLNNIQVAQDFDHIALALLPGLAPAVLDPLAGRPGLTRPEGLPPALRIRIERGEEIVWEDPGQRNALEADIAPLNTFESGCLLPVRSEDRLHGALIATRKQGRVVSAEVNNLRTFADIFGIALAQEISACVRREAERDLHEFEIAADLQQHLLPIRQPVGSGAFEVEIFQRVARNVAGDFAECLSDGHGNHTLTLIDVMGKGVSAALLGIIYRTAFTLQLEPPRPLTELLDAINRVLVHMLGDLTMFITVSILRWRDGHDEIEQINAGHCPSLIHRADGSIDEYGPSGPPIGLMPKFAYTTDRFVLRPGDSLTLVSDGCYEWQGESGLWGWSAWRDFLSASAFTNGQELWDSLLDRMTRESVTDEPADDITLVFLQKKP